MEKEGIEALQADIKTRLASLRRAENLRKRRRKKEQTRTRFYKDPFKFLKSLFTKEKSGALKTTKKDLEEHLRTTNFDSKRHEHGSLERRYRRRCSQRVSPRIASTETNIFLVRRGAGAYALWLTRRGVITETYRNSNPSVHLI